MTHYAILLEDIVSYKGSKTYAKKGDKVELITTRSNVAIVEFKGERFTVNIENLKINSWKKLRN